MANRESRSSWKDFLLQLRGLGLSGVEFVVSDDHAGLRQAIVEVLTEAGWQHVVRRSRSRSHFTPECRERLIRALAVEMHENWLEANRYLNRDDLRKHEKEALRMAA